MHFVLCSHVILLFSRLSVSWDINWSQPSRVSVRRWRASQSRRWSLTRRSVTSVSRVRQTEAPFSSNRQAIALSTWQNGSVLFWVMMSLLS